MVYKHLATLYFVFVFDSSENELAMLDLIQGNLMAYWWKRKAFKLYSVCYHAIHLFGLSCI